MNDVPVFVWTRREFDARRLAAFVAGYQREHGRPPAMRETHEHLYPWDRDRYGLRWNRGLLQPVIAEGINLGLLRRTGGFRQARSIVATDAGGWRAAS